MFHCFYDNEVISQMSLWLLFDLSNGLIDELSEQNS